jgi:hypothetical protein
MTSINIQLKFYLDNKRFCGVNRQVSDYNYKYSWGYIIDYSDNYVLMQEVEDFLTKGYLIFPKESIKSIRFNNYDKYYDKIMIWENQIDNVKKKYNLDLTTWSTIFKTIKSTGLNVIIEDENPDNESYYIGSIIKTTKNAVHINYFDAKGLLDNFNTKINFDKITIVNFDDHYINTFSKYLR